MTTEIEGDPMLACLHCGRELSPRAVACPQCGEPGPAAPPAWAAGATPAAPVSPPPSSARGTVDSVLASVNRTDPYAIASIVCAVANFVGLFLVGAILAIVFGYVADKRITENPELEGAGLARAGRIIGWVGLGLVLAMILLGFTIFGVFTSADGGSLPLRFTF